MSEKSQKPSLEPAAGSTVDSTGVDPKILFWNRLQLILVMVVFVAPVAGAFLYKPSAFNNYGDLYTPVRPVANLRMQSQFTQSNEVVELSSLRRQWVFLVVANATCNTDCEQNILKMRQLRFMQNDDMKRIRTVFLHTALAPETAKDIAAKYRPLEVYSVPLNDYDEWTKVLRLPAGTPPEAERDRFYIIDPTGNLMMSYPASADPNIIKKDIKRLLKTSQIG